MLACVRLCAPEPANTCACVKRLSLSSRKETPGSSLNPPLPFPCMPSVYLALFLPRCKGHCLARWCLWQLCSRPSGERKWCHMTGCHSRHQSFSLGQRSPIFLAWPWLEVTKGAGPCGDWPWGVWFGEQSFHGASRSHGSDQGQGEGPRSQQKPVLCPHAPPCMESLKSYCPDSL